jgi:hypothetical protein
MQSWPRFQALLDRGRLTLVRPYGPAEEVLIVVVSTACKRLATSAGVPEHRMSPYGVGEDSTSEMRKSKMTTVINEPRTPEPAFAARKAAWNAADEMRSRRDWKSLTRAERAKLYRDRIRAAQKSRTLLNRTSKRAERELRDKESAGADITVPREYLVEFITHICGDPPVVENIHAYVERQSPRRRRRKLWADRNF